MISISLAYTGALAENGVIDMYDAARGVAGLQRSLALTTHLLINGEIITQAPSLTNAQIIVGTPELGSWKITATILAGIWAVTSASKDSVPGHILFSTYDYVISSTLGFHVDFDKSLGEAYEEHLARKKITAEKLDSLIEKTESSISDIHRPIVASESATQADITGFKEFTAPRRLGPHLTKYTYDYISKTVLEKNLITLEGAVSSFNINTRKGRIFVYEEARPIPF